MTPATPRRWLVALAVAPLVALTPVAPSWADTAEQAERADDLRTDLDAILADPALEGATSGVVVTEADSGQTLYSRDADTQLLPASNMKIFTAAAALEALGGEHTFATEAVVERRPGRGDVPGGTPTPRRGLRGRW